MMNIKKPELLIPAGSMDVFETAIRYGADAIYIGGEEFGLRAMAKNFSPSEMKTAIDLAHRHNRKVYVTANIIAHNEDLKEAESYFCQLDEMKPDAIIISDPGLFDIAKRVVSDIELHISTQANNTNYGTFNFWYHQGAKRVVCARELSIEEIRDLKKNIPSDCQIEAFVHGAMCISYSGRCLISSCMTGRDANRGACTHPCRWKYYLMEEKRPGEYMPVFENDRGTYLYNSKDLCMIEHVDDLIEASVDSFKIEGRMKTALYIAITARAYRMAIDDYMESPDLYRKNLPLYREELELYTHREYTTGFFYGKTDENSQIYDANTYVSFSTYLGTVREVTSDKVSFMQKNKFSIGETIEVMKPDGRNLHACVHDIKNEKGETLESASHASQMLYVDFGQHDIEVGDILRTIRK